MKITMKLLSFMSDLHDDGDDIVHKEEGKIKAEDERKKIGERTAEAVRVKLESERLGFERLRKKFENK